MGRREREVVYAMVDHAIRLVERRYPERVAVDVAMVEYLRDGMDEPELNVVREALLQALRGVWGLSAVVEAEKRMEGKDQPHHAAQP